MRFFMLILSISLTIVGSQPLLANEVAPVCATGYHFDESAGCILNDQEDVEALISSASISIKLLKLLQSNDGSLSAQDKTTCDMAEI